MKNWIVVTGGAGYIGSHVAAKLKEDENNAVLLIDRHGTARSHATQYCDIFADEDFSSSLIHETIIKYRPTTVIHCAEDQNNNTVLDPIAVWQNNAIKTASFLKTCALAGVRNFIFLSSANIYPGGSKSHTEFDRIWPTTCFARNKNMIEQMLNDCYVAHSMNSISLRLSSVAGCDNTKNLGPLPSATGVFHNFMQSLLFNKTFEIYGNDFETPDGTPIRDFIHVNDVTCAIEQSIHWLSCNNGAHIMNLSSNNPISILNIINESEEVLSISTQYTYVGREPGSPSQLVVNNDLLSKTINWKPTHNLQNMLTSAWQWYNSMTYCELYHESDT
jgi:UDP-glucose 4-epimerase